MQAFEPIGDYRATRPLDERLDDMEQDSRHLPTERGETLRDMIDAARDIMAATNNGPHVTAYLKQFAEEGTSFDLMRDRLELLFSVEALDILGNDPKYMNRAES